MRGRPRAAATGRIAARARRQSCFWDRTWTVAACCTPMGRRAPRHTAKCRWGGKRETWRRSGEFPELPGRAESAELAEFLQAAVKVAAILGGDGRHAGEWYSLAPITSRLSAPW